MIKTVIVGSGYAAKTFHLPHITENRNYQLVGVVHPGSEEQIFGVPTFGSLEEAIQTSGASLYIITTPNQLHFDMLRTAILGNVDVLIEKPAVLSTDELNELIVLLKESSSIVNVHQNRRYDGDFLTLRDLLGENGKLKSWENIISRFDRFRPDVRNRWRENDVPGSGILYDLGTHLIDQTITLFGYPEKVFGDVRFQREGTKSDDGFMITLYYGERRVTLLSSPFVSYDYPRFEVQSKEGSFIKYGLDPQEDLLKNGRYYSDREITQEYGTLVIGADDKSQLSIKQGQYADLYDKLATSYIDRKPLIGLDQAYMTLRVIEAVKKSSDSKEIITLKDEV